MEKNTFVGVEEIEFWYREHCKDIDINFSKSNFTKFLKFLEVDVFDWVKSNLRYFNENEYYPPKYENKEK